MSHVTQINSAMSEIIFLLGGDDLCFSMNSINEIWTQVYGKYHKLFFSCVFRSKNDFCRRASFCQPITEHVGLFSLSGLRLWRKTCFCTHWRKKNTNIARRRRKIAKHQINFLIWRARVEFVSSCKSFSNVSCCECFIVSCLDHIGLRIQVWELLLKLWQLY